jgi:hypothetical protein
VICADKNLGAIIQPIANIITINLKTLSNIASPLNRAPFSIADEKRRQCATAIGLTPRKN